MFKDIATLELIQFVDWQLARGARRRRKRLGIRQKAEIRLGKRSRLGAQEANPKSKKLTS
jgi:hypothetical protein